MEEEISVDEVIYCYEVNKVGIQFRIRDVSNFLKYLMTNCIPCQNKNEAGS